AGYDNRSIPYEGALEIARVRQLRFQRQIIPDGATENPLLLEIIDFARAVDIERDHGAIAAIRKVHVERAAFTAVHRHFLSHTLPLLSALPSHPETLIEQAQLALASHGDRPDALSRHEPSRSPRQSKRRSTPCSS